MHVAPYRKFIVAVAAAVAMLVKVTVDGDLDGSGLIEVAIAFLAAAGVYRVPNEPTP